MVPSKKTIEEMYQKKTQLEHILLRPDTYVGSIEKDSKTLWVYENNTMVHRSISYVPGLYKIFDEILVNAADNKQRDPKMDCVRVNIDVEENSISVYNTGNGIPVEVHADEGVYVPEMIFGHLLTSSNYDDDEKKTTGGRNGYGAKLANIFSTEFVIETADGSRQKKYKQVFMNNMGAKSEPIITKSKANENWTKVTFKPDLAKFHMTHLEADVVGLMKKRVMDIAGCLGKSVKVELNGERVPVKDFTEYINLYLSHAPKDNEEPLPKIYEKVNDRWEVCVSRSDGQFQQVSFVNGIATIKGGTHVDYVTNQVATFVMNHVNKKNKSANLKAHTVKTHLWIFVKALIDNPAFDSQTKETLTTRAASFGSKCELSDDFLKKVVKNSGVVVSLETWAEFKQSKDLKKTDGSKKQRITGLPKLEDANDAGGRNSEKCTLILTEGDSAKSLAMAGISVVGRDSYGVFPLRGKLLNVREASHKQISENAEIQNIKRIMGLQHNKDYDSVKSLRYGHLMIMTDQDHDGSHIKGLLINFIHKFWPSLLKIPSFLVEFITPIVKVKKKNQVLSFYSMPEYESWKESVGETNASGWTAKYYKGLGTNTAEEGKSYFNDLLKHKKDFVWADDKDGDAIDLAFSRKKIEARKNWLRQFNPDFYLDNKDKLIRYSDFVNKELILFSRADLQRSIPSMVDGLKPGQRKVLYCSFKELKDSKKEIKVAQFSGTVAKESEYHHGEQSLVGTIVGMAQDFVGSNNINLLQPIGQFGTRHQGGKDSANGRYIFTGLSPITRFLFAKEDDVLLNYLNEDGTSVEPSWYMPIIPMVLVNGSEGIGTGWSSYVPNYNPRDIIKNIKHLINEEPMEPMFPWYKGFNGTIEKTATKESGATFTVSGVIEEIDEITLKITELPIRKWTQDYKEFLESSMTGSDKIKEPFIEEFMDQSDDIEVDFEVILTSENLLRAKNEGLIKKFKLTSTISTGNMHLFDQNGIICKYDTPEEILQEFYHLRFEMYKKRKRVVLENLERELMILDNKARFVLGVVKGEIIVSNRKKAELLKELKLKGFAPFPKTKNDNAVVDETMEEETNEESGDLVVGSAGVKASDYEYLLSMAISSLTLEKVQELLAKKRKSVDELEEYKGFTITSLWLKDLEKLSEKLDEQDVVDVQEAVKRKEQKDKLKKKAGNKGSKQVKITKKAIGKKTANIPSAANAIEESFMADIVSEVVKLKIKGGPRKAPAKKVQKEKAPVDSDEDDEILELKDRLAAYNLESSPDQSTAMEAEATQVPAKQKPTQRAAAKKPTSKKSQLEDEEDMQTILEDDDSDVEFALEVVVNTKGGKKGGRKPAAIAKPAAAVAKKRGPAPKHISEVLKPIENASRVSPANKVRKTRPSPFNKKSGSVLEKKQMDISPMLSTELSATASGSSNEVIAPRQRPQRVNRLAAKYVLSDSEPETGSDDSDFDVIQVSEDE